MKRTEAIYLIYEELSSYVRNAKHTENNRSSLASCKNRLFLAYYLVRLAETYDARLAQEPSDKPDNLPMDIVDAFKNPFAILEQETKSMRLDENIDWDEPTI